MVALPPHLSSAPSGLARLDHHGVLRASGADAASFLHSQLSNDVSQLGAGQARLAAWCNAQGRMLASFVLTAAPAGAEAPEFWLACRADLIPATQKRLAMFILRAKARLVDGSAELAVLGLAGAAAQAWVTAQSPAGLGPAAWSAADAAGGRLVRLPDAALSGAAGSPALPRWLWMGPQAAAEALTAQLPALPLSRWDALEISAGVVPVQAATATAFVPQMLNYELVGGVDFRKGCYPGQEVVARSQYLGKLKRRAAAFVVDATGGSPAQAGQEVWWSGDSDQPAGLVAQAAEDGGRAWLLAEMKLAALKAGDLRLGHAQGPLLQRVALPYALPQEGEAGAAQA
ncbi:MAG: hypothetical protein RL722_1475 [Pseudomonadota bacterium]|jgi:folate-binding protein YgfZ